MQPQCSRYRLPGAQLAQVGAFRPKTVLQKRPSLTRLFANALLQELFVPPTILNVGCPIGYSLRKSPQKGSSANICRHRNSSLATHRTHVRWECEGNMKTHAKAREGRNPIHRGHELPSWAKAKAPYLKAPDTEGSRGRKRPGPT